MQRHSAIFYPRFWGVIYKYIITSYIFQFKHNSKVLIESIIIFISPPMIQDYNIKRTENNSLSRPAGEWGGLTAFWPTLSCLLCLTAPDPRAHEVLGGQSSEVKAICQARVKLLQTAEATFFFSLSSEQCLPLSFHTSSTEFVQWDTKGNVSDMDI